MIINYHFSYHFRLSSGIAKFISIKLNLAVIKVKIGKHLYKGESCSLCKCHQGQVLCQEADCDAYGNDSIDPATCHYSVIGSQTAWKLPFCLSWDLVLVWSSWTVCNSTCSDETSSKFRFRAPRPYKSGCTETMDIGTCDELPKCSKVCKGRL